MIRHTGRWGRGLSIALAGAVLGLGPAHARADERLVRNDSFENGQSAVIVGDFVPGEHAGVRLTSPCDGAIVAVQIGWLAGDPNAEPTIERAIHIYDGSTFPEPSTEWARLDSPLLTPGFFNEFRYLDEAQQIPINIPIQAGQRFTVTLEFDNFTRVAQGGPSVFRDVDGCQPGKNVLFAIPGGWMDFCVFLRGDLVIRAIVDCQSVTGACCKVDGTCQEMTRTQCDAIAGTYQGDATRCQDVTCPEAFGACCFESTGQCLNLRESQCRGAGGIFQGGGTRCQTTVCFPRGACCLPDGSCVNDVSPEECQALNGAFQGDGSDCANVVCPDPLGACCFASGFCLDLSQTDCAAAAGTWHGPGTDCTDGDGDGTADECEQTVCDPCDANCDGAVNASDIQPFIDLLFNGATGCDTCSGDVNGDGSVNAQDIAGFIDCLF